MKYRNVKEAKIVGNIVNALSPKEVDVKILTPYNSQKSHLQKTLRKYLRWICTVDEFQGREADIIILSLVRNNRSTISGRRWGFLRDPTRLNVMFSRAREILIVVGSLTHIFDTEFYPDETELRGVAERFRSKAKIIKPDDISREMEL
jgi:superfamily I DNA and/or RNA helicase